MVGQVGMGYNKENTPWTCCVEYVSQTRAEVHMYPHQENGSRWAWSPLSLQNKFLEYLSVYFLLL